MMDNNKMEYMFSLAKTALIGFLIPFYCIYNGSLVGD